MNNANHSSGGLAQFHRLFQRTNQPRHTRLDRGSLPTPLQYLTDRGLHKNKQRGQWVAIFCPVHKGGTEDHPSMRVNTIDGHFKCMACGAKGGDLVALHRLITGLGFRDAVRDLGGCFHD